MGLWEVGQLVVLFLCARPITKGWATARRVGVQLASVASVNPSWFLFENAVAWTPCNERASPCLRQLLACDLFVSGEVLVFALSVLCFLFFCPLPQCTGFLLCGVRAPDVVLVS